jgi:hypothetical protein
MSRQYLQLQQEAALGNVDALVFLLSWNSYIHAVDDLVDEAMTPDLLLDCLMQANALYATPFWIANSARLAGIIALVANAYADSLKFEHGPEDWKRRHADVLRQAGNEMVIAVAQIVGGWRHARSISLRVREQAYHEQHEEVKNVQI